MIFREKATKKKMKEKSATHKDENLNMKMSIHCEVSIKSSIKVLTLLTFMYIQYTLL